jgi:hypothetical protein
LIGNNRELPEEEARTLLRAVYLRLIAEVDNKVIPTASDPQKEIAALPDESRKRVDALMRRSFPSVSPPSALDCLTLMVSVPGTTVGR